MSHLHRELAPVSPAGWTEIHEAATRTLTLNLAARKLIDFSGPHGWEYSAVAEGRVEPEPAHSPVEGVRARRRLARPLTELRADFAVSRDELDAVDRGAEDMEDAPVVDAARRLALAEDRAVFDGDPDAGISGIVPGSPHDPIAAGEDFEDYPRFAARAAAVLRDAGVDGPYAIALGTRAYTGVIESTERGGYPVLEHLRLILKGPVVWSPSLDGAVVLSQRGGDFSLVVGQDVAVGYSSHDDDAVRLYLEESFTFRCLGPEAAVALIDG